MRLPGPVRWLWPLSLLYAMVVRLRASLYGRETLPKRRLKGTVISVGNLTLGGTGKTPLVAWIAERLLGERKKVGILTRGYRGAQAGNTKTISSDEVALLRARLGDQVQFGVGPDRYQNGLRLERNGVEWFVLDDAFQHLRLARDADIVLIDATDAFGGGRVLPAGRLREPVSALARADIVVITRSEHSPAIETLVRRYTRAQIFYATTRLQGVFAYTENGGSETFFDGRGKSFLAFCGIGNPAAFFEDLGRWGIQVVERASFRDHHRYSQWDADLLERKAQAAGASALICTEKDIFNFAETRFRPLPLFFASASLELSDAETFWGAVQQTVQQKRGRVWR